MIYFTDVLYASSDALQLAVVHETCQYLPSPGSEGHDAKYVELRTVFVDTDVAYRKA
jgi:hypothetical protein